MKKLILLFTTGFITSMAMSQITPVSNESMSSQERTERIEAIDKELKKIEKKISKGSSTIQKSEDLWTKAEGDKDYNEKQQMEYLSKIAEVKGEMNGYDLHSLEEKISRLEKNNRKLNSENDRNSRLIAKKLAEIERLKAEIETLEGETYDNKREIQEVADDIVDTQEIISRNGLVEKDERLKAYEKEMESLKKEEKKLHSTIEKNKNLSTKEKDLREQNAQRKQVLKEEKERLKTTENSASIPN